MIPFAPWMAVRRPGVVPVSLAAFLWHGTLYSFVEWHN